MSEIKAGDWMAVKIADTREDSGLVAIVSPSDYHGHYWLSLSSLHPLSAPDPLTDAERAVVEAAEKWAQAHADIEEDHGTFGAIRAAEAEFWTAVRALRAARQPPDPVREAIAAWEEWSTVNGISATRLNTAMAALAAHREKDAKS